MDSHPIAKIFAPAVFLSLVLLSLGFSIGSAQAQAPASPTAAPRIERFDLDPPDRLAPGEALIFRLSGGARGVQELSTVLAQPLVENSPVAASQRAPARRTNQ